jgi:hypothetical protein
LDVTLLLGICGRIRELHEMSICATERHFIKNDGLLLDFPTWLF